ncbi:motility associated factor glycosyltransferase family protein [Arcobacter cloacae]|uniref:Motility accessory factor n=1 Tax=Arcobacter cloacae TaxID=1054034 RepID=A0A4Q0ZDP9_9BACT|nr:6-hydroxymethylpterin diphosphokinase MptE-like protein [Arcobacter cloacae]RXJ84409.1 hypothetical protein CRU90_05940 [Arcobacter cloacae]
MTESQAEEILQNTLIQQYISNLQFLKEKDFELFNKINLLSNMIDEGIYQERFALEFIKENGEFDILNLETNEYFYARNAKLINHHLLKNADFSKKFTFSNFIDNLYLKRDKDIEISDSIYKVLDNVSLNNMSEFTTIWGDGYEDNKEFLEIDKYFFFGNYLGTHLKEFQLKMKFKCCFIYEPNLEIFRLSLFITDYKSLNDKSEIIFSIMDEDKDFIEKVNAFLSSIYIYSNYNIKNCQIIEVKQDLIHKIFNELYISNNATYDYAKMLYINYFLTTKHINKYKILTTRNKSINFSISDDKPVLLIAAGPSLGKNIKWIKENQNKFVIVAIGAVYKKLFDNDIIPDIVTTVDPQYKVLDTTHFNEEDVKLLKDTIVLASINTPTKILSRFNQDKLYLFEIGDSFKNNSMAYSGLSIGETTLFILLDMGIKSIYLIGTDLAFDEKSGLSHFEGYVNKKNDFQSDTSKFDEVLSTGKSSVKEFIQVKGNKKEKVVTNRMFALSINQYVRIINHFKKENQKIYNLCEDGAYIEGTIVENNLNINLNEEFSKKFLFENFEKISEFGLTSLEQKEVDKNLLKVKKVIKVLNEEFLKNNSSNLLEFNNKIVSFIKVANKNVDKIFIKIILSYFNFVIPYIYYSLNDAKLESKLKKNNLKQTEKILNKQLKNLIEIYESYLLEIKKG